MQLNLMFPKQNQFSQPHQNDYLNDLSQRKINFNKIAQIKILGDKLSKPRSFLHQDFSQTLKKIENPHMFLNENDNAFHSLSSSSLNHNINEIPHQSNKITKYIPQQHIRSHSSESEKEKEKNNINQKLSKHLFQVKQDFNKISLEPSQISLHQKQYSTKICLPLNNLKGWNNYLIPKSEKQNIDDNNYDNDYLSNIQKAETLIKDEQDNNKLSKKCLKYIKKQLLETDNKYETHNYQEKKSYHFMIEKIFYSLIISKKDKRIVSISKHEHESKEMLFQEENKICRELVSLTDTIKTVLLAKKRNREE